MPRRGGPRRACHGHFHLAFKDIDTEEMYDVLMEQMVRAIKQYDPSYTEKVKRIVEIIDHELSERTRFTVADVSRYLEFDSDRYIRLLCRRGFLSSHGKIGREKEGYASPPRTGMQGRHDPGTMPLIDTLSRIQAPARREELNPPTRLPALSKCLPAWNCRHELNSTTHCYTLEEFMRDYPSRTTGEPPLHLLLRRRRQELNLLQADVAEAVGVSAEAVVLWEAARRRMELSRLPRIAEALQLDPRELCMRAIAEFHPTVYATLFGPRDETPAAMHPAA